MDDPLLLDLDALPPLSPLAMELLALRISDDDAEQRLQRIVSSEPQLAARLVAVANSAAFGLGNVRFSTVPLALRRIGLRRASQLAIALLFGHAAGARLPQRMREKLWLHSLALASAASEIARLKQLPEPGEAYLAGLLHDLGYMLAELQAPGALGRVQARALAQQCSLEDAERQEFGIDHAELTARVLAHWKVPSQLVEVLRDHHRADLASGSLGAVVHGAELVLRIDDLAADLYAGHDGHPFCGLTEERERSESRLWQRLELDSSALEAIVGRVACQVAGLAGFAKAMTLA